MFRQYRRRKHTLDQIIIIKRDATNKTVNRHMCYVLHMLPEIDKSKNYSQLFDICIRLAIPMYIEITYNQQMAIVGSNRVIKFRRFFERICSFQAILLSWL